MSSQESRIGQRNRRNRKNRGVSKHPGSATSRVESITGFCQAFEHYGIDDLVCQKTYRRQQRPPWAQPRGAIPLWFPCNRFPTDACQRVGEGPRAQRMGTQRPCACLPGRTPIINPYEGRPGVVEDPHARGTHPTVVDYEEAVRAEDRLRRLRQSQGDSNARTYRFCRLRILINSDLNRPFIKILVSWHPRPAQHICALVLCVTIILPLFSVGRVNPILALQVNNFFQASTPTNTSQSRYSNSLAPRSLRCLLSTPAT